MLSADELEKMTADGAARKKMKPREAAQLSCILIAAPSRLRTSCGENISGKLVDEIVTARTSASPSLHAFTNRRLENFESFVRRRSVN